MDPSQDIAPEMLPCPNCPAMPPSLFGGVIAMYRYQDAVRDAVVAAKFTRYATITSELGRRLGQHCRIRQGDEPSVPEWTVVTNVPGRRWRQMRRGGSGTAILAQSVARQIGASYRPLLRCVRPMSKQAWLDDAERLENVRDAFAIARSFAISRAMSRPAERFLDKDVLLVDDVFTTGATAGEISRVLLQAGARSVWIAVVARTVRDRVKV